MLSDVQTADRVNIKQSTNANSIQLWQNAIITFSAEIKED